jgi:hypothetical protein
MFERHLVALVATILVAGCSAVPHAPGPADLGVPAAIGDWAMSDVTPDPQTDVGKVIGEFTSTFMDAAGATPATGAWAWFEVRDAGGVLVTKVDGYRVIGVEPDALWRGADRIGFTDLSPVAVTTGGWDLRHVSDGDGWIAVRGDRLFAFSGGPPEPTRDEVQRFLDAVR